jgi:hypothetical protein
MAAARVVRCGPGGAGAAAASNRETSHNRAFEQTQKKVVHCPVQWYNKHLGAHEYYPNGTT